MCTYTTTCTCIVVGTIRIGPNNRNDRTESSGDVVWAAFGLYLIPAAVCPENVRRAGRKRIKVARGTIAETRRRRRLQ